MVVAINAQSTEQLRKFYEMIGVPYSILVENWGWPDERYRNNKTISDAEPILDDSTYVIQYYVSSYSFVTMRINSSRVDKIIVNLQQQDDIATIFWSATYSGILLEEGFQSLSGDFKNKEKNRYLMDTLFVSIENYGESGDLKTELQAFSK